MVPIKDKVKVIISKRKTECLNSSEKLPPFPKISRKNREMGRRSSHLPHFNILDILFEATVKYMTGLLMNGETNRCTGKW